MKAPKLPSFYKNQGLQGFKFTPRYYKPNARKNKNLGENHKKIKQIFSYKDYWNGWINFRY